ncbi:MAG: hypothetical protein GXY76_14870 [Chloroflexi bacterium]|nr:hypothetical protein [Chloroflexota bacterium]
MIEKLARYRGVPVLLGVMLLAASLVVHLAWPGSWLVRSELLLHLGLIVALLGLLIGDALGG